MRLLTNTLQAMQKNQLIIMEKLFGTPQASVQPGPSSIPITISLPTCGPTPVAVTQPPPYTTQSSQNYTDVINENLSFLWELSSELKGSTSPSGASSVCIHTASVLVHCQTKLHPHCLHLSSHCHLKNSLTSFLPLCHNTCCH